jgi:hypothetical protein
MVATQLNIPVTGLLAIDLLESFDLDKIGKKCSGSLLSPRTSILN